MKYNSCRYNGERMRKHVAVYLLFTGRNAVPHGMVIHHKDFDRMNNSFDNLVCITKEEHDRLHSAMRKRDERGRFK